MRERREALRNGLIPPTSGAQSMPHQVSALEQYYRSMVLGQSMKGPRYFAAVWRSRKTGAGVVRALGPYLQNFEVKRRSALTGPTYSSPNVKKTRACEEFPICRIFLRKRACKFQDQCKQSHDIQAYQRWQLTRIKTGQLVRSRAINRGGLLYELCYSEILEYEKVLMQCFKVLIKHNFWLDHDNSGNSGEPSAATAQQQVHTSPNAAAKLPHTSLNPNV